MFVPPVPGCSARHFLGEVLSSTIGGVPIPVSASLTPLDVPAAPIPTRLPISPAVFTLRIGETGEERGRRPLLPVDVSLWSEGRRKRMEPRADCENVKEGDWRATGEAELGGGGVPSCN